MKTPVPEIETAYLKTSCLEQQCVTNPGITTELMKIHSKNNMQTIQDH